MTSLMKSLLCFLATISSFRAVMINFDKKRSYEVGPTGEYLPPAHGPWIVSTDDDGSNIDYIVTELTHLRKQHKVQKRKLLASTSPGDKHGDKKETHYHLVEGLTEDELHSVQGVVHVYPDLPMEAQSYSWGVDRIDQWKLPLNGRAYRPAYNGKGVDVYVLDSGIDTTHQEFASPEDSEGHRRKVKNLFNAFTSEDVSGSSNIDDNGHGTHVAGTVGGTTIGVSPKANLYGVKVLDWLGSSKMSTIMSGLTFVRERHASLQSASPQFSVVNLSLGGRCYLYGCKNDPLISLVKAMASEGIAFSISAGNDAADAYWITPASATGILTVAASSDTDELATFSNYGGAVDIVAPGVTIWSACYQCPSGATCPISSSSNFRNDGALSALPICTDGQHYTALSGTSMAAPHVAGLLAQELEKLSQASSGASIANQEVINNANQAVKDNAATNMITMSNSLALETTKDLVQAPKAIESTVDATTTTDKATTTGCLGPFKGYTNCEAKIGWTMLNKDLAWYYSKGIDRTRCSIQQYWSTSKFKWCPSMNEIDVLAAGGTMETLSILDKRISPTTPTTPTAPTTPTTHSKSGPSKATPITSAKVTPITPSTADPERASGRTGATKGSIDGTVGAVTYDVLTDGDIIITGGAFIDDHALSLDTDDDRDNIALVGVGPAPKGPKGLLDEGDKDASLEYITVL